VGIGIGMKSILMGLLLIFVLRFAVNFWYAQINGVGTGPKVLASIFSGCGFIYLMGLDKNIPGALAILDDTIKIYEKNFKDLVLYPLLQFASIVGLVLLGVIIWILASFLPQIAQYIIIILFSVAIFVAIVIASILFMIGLYLAIKRVADGLPRLNIKETLKLSWGKFASFLGSSILGYLYAVWPLIIALLLLGAYATTTMAYSLGGINTNALLQGSRAFVVVVTLAIIYSIFHFIYFSIRLVFNYLSVLFADQKAKESLNYSKTLTKGHWWAVAWRISAPAWIVAFLVMILSFIIEIFSFFGPVGVVITNILSLGLQIMITPIVAIIMVLVYQHLERQRSTTPTSL